MSKWLRHGFVAICCWAAAGSVMAFESVLKLQPAPRAAPAELSRRLAAVLKVVSSVSEADAPALAAELEAIMKDPGFSRLSERERYVAHWSAEIVDKTMGKFESAYQHRLRMAEVYPAAKVDGDYWLRLSGTAARADHYDAAADALVRMFEVEPAKGNELYYSFLLNVVRKSGKLSDRGPHRRLLETLWRVDYQPDEGFATSKYLWWELFEARAADGNGEAARQVLPRLPDAEYVIRLRADKRYRAYAGDLPAGGDYRNAYRQERAEARARVAAHPELIEGQTMLADYLVCERRYAEALAVLDAALAKADAAPKDRPAFSDLDDHYQWTVEARANALRGLGRWDDVTAGKVKAKAAATQNDTVSQALNLGVYYVAIEKPGAALAEADAIGPGQVSGYGAMVAAEIRVCAYAQLGKSEERDHWLGYMKAHESEGPALYLEGLRCAGDLDALAKAVIAQLVDTESRNDTLVDLQDYDGDPALTPHEKRMKDVDTAVKARSDVRSAIAAYGFVEAYSLKGIEP